MRVSLRCVVVMILGLASSPTQGLRAQEASPPALFLTDPRGLELLSSHQAWGELGVDTAVRPAGRDGAPLKIGDHAYPRGLGHHANGEITVDLDGRFLSFDAEAGVQNQGGNTAASVVFQVYVDGRKAFDSGVVRESDAPRTISVSTKGAGELRLVVTDAGDGIACDCANWAMARLAPDPTAAAADRPKVNVAAFGRLMSWDPARETGTAASRIGEFPAEDIEPGRQLVAGADGVVMVPDQGGRGGFGVQWPESRSLRRLELEFADPATAPADDSVVAETWIGESSWQGRWVALEGGPKREDGRLVWETEGTAWRTPTPKVRWVFPTGGRAVAVKSVEVFTRSRWRAEEVRIEADADAKARTRPIEVYNGVLIDPPGRLEFQGGEPLTVRLLSCVPRADKTDRTVLRFGPDPGGFAVAVEDVLAHGSVAFAGVRVSAVDRAGEVDNLAPTVTPGVLDEVRRRPDETLDQAMKTVHRDTQDLGPMMLSLACDNRKLVVDRDGIVVFDVYEGINDEPRAIPKQWRLQVRPGAGKNAEVSRRLRGGWWPIPETTTSDGPVVYRQATFVAPIGEAGPDRPAWVRDRALGVVELTIGNDGDNSAPVSASFAMAGAGEATATTEGFRTTITSGGRVLAIIDASESAALEVRPEATGLSLTGSLSPRSRASCVALIPLWRLDPGETIEPPAGSTWGDRTVEYWDAVLAPAMQVELPEPFLVNLIRASQVHCLMAARSEDSGRRVAAWISADRYGPWESEAQAVIRGMDMLGHAEFARRSLEFFIKRYSPEGFLTTGYTIVGTGEHLWTLAEHVDRTQGEDWLRTVAPEFKRVCDWVVRQRAKTKLTGANGRPVPSFGLMPPGVSADWNRFAYRFFNDAQFAAGLSEAARVLGKVDDPAAPGFAAEAAAYRDDLLAAYRWTRARSPILPLGDGRWTPAQPSLLESFGHVEEFQPGEDANRSWAYSVELGPNHLAATGILDPRSAEVGEMLDYLEGSAFLRSGMGEYPEEESRADPFGLGGFAKVQPFYARVAEIYAERDDVKPFLRAYFHALSSLVSRENMSFWEHFHNTGGWNKTHETGWFLCQSRLMFVQERGDDLWLAPLISDRWLEDGKSVTVRDAPTRFGKVGYSIESHVGDGHVKATIHPPDGPRRIVLRLRHPEGEPIRAVTVDGRAHDGFDPTAQTVTLPATGKSLTVRVEY